MWKRAARVVGQTPTDFMREAVLQRAHEVLAAVTRSRELSAQAAEEMAR